MLSQQELVSSSTVARDAAAAAQRHVEAEQTARNEAHNRLRADEVLAKLDAQLGEAAAKGKEPWLIVWHTANNEYSWNTKPWDPVPLGLRLTSIAALIRDGCIARGYRVRSYWNIVVDFSPNGLGNYYQEHGADPYGDTELDGHHYVGG